MTDFNRGDVILVKLKDQNARNGNGELVRPAVIVSSDTLNANLNTILVCPIIEANGISESRSCATFVHQDVIGLGKNCLVLSFQVRSLEKSCILRRVGSLPNVYFKQIQEGLMAALEID